jgi:hypothetical protein
MLPRQQPTILAVGKLYIPGDQSLSKIETKL